MTIDLYVDRDRQHGRDAKYANAKGLQGMRFTDEYHPRLGSQKRADIIQKIVTWYCTDHIQRRETVVADDK